MDLQPNKQDAIVLPITNTRISASEWNQLVGSCMAFITAAGLTPDALDNEQFLNAFKIVAANLELIGANTNLSNLTAIGEEKFSAKADVDLSNVVPNIDYVVQSKIMTDDAQTWWRVYQSGWVEMGGIVYNTSANPTITFPKQMSSLWYDVNVCIINNGSTSSGYGFLMNAQTTYMQVASFAGSAIRWSVKGQGANL